RPAIAEQHQRVDPPGVDQVAEKARPVLQRAPVAGRAGGIEQLVAPAEVDLVDLGTLGLQRLAQSPEKRPHRALKQKHPLVCEAPQHERLLEVPLSLSLKSFCRPARFPATQSARTRNGTSRPV